MSRRRSRWRRSRPRSLQLRDAIETTRREIERARQVQDMLRRARTRFSEGSFEGAIRAVGELLAIDPDNAAARDLQTRAQEAIDARAHRAERDTAAQAVVTEARALFEKGDKDSAIARLEAFTPPHDLVSGFLASLRGEQVAEALQEPVVAGPDRAFTSASTRKLAGTPDSGASVPAAARSRTPIYAAGALAARCCRGRWRVRAWRGSTGEAPTPAAASPDHGGQRGARACRCRRRLSSRPRRRSPHSRRRIKTIATRWRRTSCCQQVSTSTRRRSSRRLRVAIRRTKTSRICARS